MKEVALLQQTLGSPSVLESKQLKARPPSLLPPSALHRPPSSTQIPATLPPFLHPFPPQHSNVFGSINFYLVCRSQRGKVRRTTDLSSTRSSCPYNIVLTGLHFISPLTSSFSSSGSSLPPVSLSSVLSTSLPLPTTSRPSQRTTSSLLPSSTTLKNPSDVLLISNWSRNLTPSLLATYKKSQHNALGRPSSSFALPSSSQHSRQKGGYSVREGGRCCWREGRLASE